MNERWSATSRTIHGRSVTTSEWARSSDANPEPARRPAVRDTARHRATTAWTFGSGRARRDPGIGVAGVEPRRARTRLRTGTGRVGILAVSLGSAQARSRDLRTARESEGGVSADVLRLLWLRRKTEATTGRLPQMTPRLASQPSRARGGPASGVGSAAPISLAKSAWWWPALLGQVSPSLTGDGNVPVPGGDQRSSEDSECRFGGAWFRSGDARLHTRRSSAPGRTVGSKRH